MLETVGTPGLWTGFLLFVFMMLALDLGIFNRKDHVISIREALGWSAVWIAMAGLFNLLVWHWFGPVRGLEFAAGYLIEKALALDNIFVFIVIFSVFGIPATLQHRVLFWGILGALVMRAVFIAAGAALLARFHWTMYVFGLVLIATGIKMLMHRGQAVDPADNPLVSFVRRMIPSTDGLRDAHFFVREDGRWRATPLLLALAAIEFSDVVFAIDSIPAIFAVTTDPFIVFTSNIFAILGLRSLYFALAGLVVKFRYLDLALAGVLMFVGLKMLAADVVKVPIEASLLVIVAMLGAGIAASLMIREGPRPVTVER